MELKEPCLIIDTLQYPRKVLDSGYVTIKVEGLWIREHIFVVETFLGRKLKEDECVHHTNFCKQDNRIQNLCLFKHDEHSKFHRQSRQFGNTTPRRLQIENNIIQVKLRSLDRQGEK